MTAPLNDNFADAVLLTGSFPITRTGDTNVDATIESGEPSPYEIVGASVWYAWESTATQTAEITLAGSDFDTTLGVYAGAAVDDLTLVAFNDDWNSLQSRVSFRADPSTTYYIQVGGYTGDAGNIDLTLSAIPGPDNDDFQSATVLSGALPIMLADQTTLGATTEFNEPTSVNYGEVDPANEAWSVQATVWYRWTATASGLVRVRLESDFNTVLGVYEGSAVDDLTRLASSDVGWNAPHYEVVYLAAVFGQTYHFQVGSYDGEQGGFSLTLSSFARPANDDFSNAEEIAGKSVTVAGSNEGASIEASEPRPEDGIYYAITDRTVWYRWTAPTSGEYEVFLEGASFFPRLTVFSGTALASLSTVAMTEQPSSYSFSAEQDTTYFVRVASAYQNSDIDGSFSFTLRRYYEPVVFGPDEGSGTHPLNEPWEVQSGTVLPVPPTALRGGATSASLLYGDGIWVWAGSASTTPAQIKVFTSTDPLSDAWTEIFSWTVPTDATYNYFSIYRFTHLVWGQGGRWALYYGNRIYWTTDNWQTYDYSEPTFSLPTGYTTHPRKIAAGADWWVVLDSGDQMWRAESFDGPWSLVPKPDDMRVLNVLSNGERWLVSGVYESTAAVDDTGLSYYGRSGTATTTDIVSPTWALWSTPLGSSSATSYGVMGDVRWLPDSREWIGTLTMPTTEAGRFAKWFYSDEFVEDWSIVEQPSYGIPGIGSYAYNTPVVAEGMAIWMRGVGYNGVHLFGCVLSADNASVAEISTASPQDLLYSGVSSSTFQYVWTTYGDGIWAAHKVVSGTITLCCIEVGADGWGLTAG